MVGIIEGGPGSRLPATIYAIQHLANAALEQAQGDGFDLSIRFQWAGRAWDPGAAGLRVIQVSKKHRSVDVDVFVADEIAWSRKHSLEAAIGLYAAAIEAAAAAARRRKAPFDHEAYARALESASGHFGASAIAAEVERLLAVEDDDGRCAPARDAKGDLTRGGTTRG